MNRSAMEHLYNEHNEHQSLFHEHEETLIVLRTDSSGRSF